MSDAQASLFLNADVLLVNANGTNPRQIACAPDPSCACNLTAPPAHESAVWASDFYPTAAAPSPGAATTKAPPPRQRSFVALFNLKGGSPSVLGRIRSEVSVSLNQIRPGWGAGSDCNIRDLWQRRPLGKVANGRITVSLAMHDAALLELACDTPASA